MIEISKVLMKQQEPAQLNSIRRRHSHPESFLDDGRFILMGVQRVRATSVFFLSLIQRALTRNGSEPQIAEKVSIVIHFRKKQSHQLDNVMTPKTERNVTAMESTVRVASFLECT